LIGVNVKPQPAFVHSNIAEVAVSVTVPPEFVSAAGKPKNKPTSPERSAGMGLGIVYKSIALEPA
jgi:hypothetical protein